MEFGAFTVKQRNARAGHNPRTGGLVQVDEKAVPAFKAGKEMLRRLNGRQPAPRPDSSGRNRCTLWASASPVTAKRLPARDGAHELPRLRVVGDAWEAPPQLNRSRELAALLVDGADGSLVRLGDDEHRWSMGRQALVV